MRVNALQKRNAGIELLNIAKLYKEYRPDLNDQTLLRLAILDNPELGESYLARPVRRDAVDEVRKFLLKKN